MKKLWRYQLSSFFFILTKINHGFIVVKCSNVFGRFITICIGQFYYKYHGLRYNVLMFDTMVNLCLPWFNYSNHVFVFLVTLVNFRKSSQPLPYCY